MNIYEKPAHLTKRTASSNYPKYIDIGGYIQGKIVILIELAVRGFFQLAMKIRKERGTKSPALQLGLRPFFCQEGNTLDFELRNFAMGSTVPVQSW